MYKKTTMHNGDMKEFVSAAISADAAWAQRSSGHDFSSNHRTVTAYGHLPDGRTWMVGHRRVEVATTKAQLQQKALQKEHHKQRRKDKQAQTTLRDRQDRMRGMDYRHGMRVTGGGAAGGGGPSGAVNAIQGAQRLGCYGKMGGPPANGDDGGGGGFTSGRLGFGGSKREATRQRRRLAKGSKGNEGGDDNDGTLCSSASSNSSSAQCLTFDPIADSEPHTTTSTRAMSVPCHTLL